MPRLSIPTRIFIAFAMILVGFGTIAISSVIQHERSARRLRLLHDGYLPLALRLGEAKAQEGIHRQQLERLGEGSLETRAWLEAASLLRPATLRRVRDHLEQAERLARAVSPEESRTLSPVRDAFDAVEGGYAELDGQYAALFALVERGGGQVEISAFVARIQTREQEVTRAFRDGYAHLQRRIAEISASAAVQERRAALVLGIVALFALVLGALLTWWARNLLEPLPLLQTRVAAVAAGDLSERPLATKRSDEIGRLAADFEAMVQALGARDERLAQLRAEQLQNERLVAIGRMAAHVTHEVRNPLSSIGLNVELLRDELQSAAELDVEEARELLSAIQGEIDRLTAITEEYLRLARLPQPALHAEDVGGIVREVTRFVTPELEAAGHTLRLELEPELPPVRVDEGQLRQALLNLLRNAREAMTDPGEVRCVVRRPSTEARVEILVGDEGVGIPDDVRARIFELFFTTKERGTGLGLALTKQIVAAHEGEIRCEAGAGGGTDFVIAIPIAHGDPTGEVRAGEALAG